MNIGSDGVYTVGSRPVDGVIRITLHGPLPAALRLQLAELAGIRIAEWLLDEAPASVIQAAERPTLEAPRKEWDATVIALESLADWPPPRDVLQWRQVRTAAQAIHAHLSGHSATGQAAVARRLGETTGSWSRYVRGEVCPREARIRDWLDRADLRAAVGPQGWVILPGF
jgi:hypothetical protein